MTRRNRQSSSRDYQELPKREQKAIREGMDALYGGGIRRIVRCPYCGTTDRRKHAPECKLGGFVT